MRAAVLLSIVWVAACAGNKASSDSDPGAVEDVPEERGTETGPGGRAENIPSVTYANSAEENWKLGEEAFTDEDYLVAQRYYSFIRNKFPYSQYAASSALRIGDCQFARERYIESIDSYQNFSRLYPTHDKVPYAMLRIGLSYFEQIPGD